jgi:8-oxo-dGTP pyrophosphatase MutT (NUDIX family)
MQHQQKAGAIVVNSRGSIAVITNNLGRCTFPKGSIEAGEEPIDTARREVTEETGLKELVVHELLGILERPGYTDKKTDEPSVIKRIYVYFFTTTQPTLQPSGSDVVSAAWIEPEHLPDTLSWPEETEFFNQHRHKLI